MGLSFGMLSSNKPFTCKAILVFYIFKNRLIENWVLATDSTPGGKEIDNLIDPIPKT